MDLTGDSVEVEARALGINFKDIPTTLGVIEMIGLEPGAGKFIVVRKVGPHANNLKEGDRLVCNSEEPF